MGRGEGKEERRGGEGDRDNARVSSRRWKGGREGGRERASMPRHSLHDLYTRNTALVRLAFLLCLRLSYSLPASPLIRSSTIFEDSLVASDDRI